MENLNIIMEKRKFSTFLYYTFLPKCPLDLRFIHFSDFPPPSAFLTLLNPGIYAIHCFGTNHTYFRHGTDLFNEMLDDLESLKLGKKNKYFYKGPSLLLEDYLKYDVDCFIFIIFCFGPEWKSFEKREQKIEDIKSFWTYELYELNQRD